MAAGRQKCGETVHAPRLGRVRWNAAGSRDALDRSVAGCGRKHDNIFTAPGAATAVRRITQGLDQTTAGGDLLELALREESDVAAIGRPEGVGGALGARHRLCPERIPGP